MSTALEIDFTICYDLSNLFVYRRQVPSHPLLVPTEVLVGLRPDPTVTLSLPPQIKLLSSYPLKLTLPKLTRLLQSSVLVISFWRPLVLHTTGDSIPLKSPSPFTPRVPVEEVFRGD